MSGTTETASPPRTGRARLADVLAGVSVALIVVPQGMAYAELAGVPAHHGLYASALPPLAAAFFASSPYLQTGPTALTSILAFGALTSLGLEVGSPAYVGHAAVLALVVAVTRIAIGFTRSGPIAYMMSQPVLRGFTIAAALLILSSQLPSVLGHVPDVPGVIPRVLGALGRPDLWSAEALVLSAVTLVLMLGGRRLHPLFPGVLIAVVAGALASVWTGYDGDVVGEVPRVFLPPLTFDLPWLSLPRLLTSGVVIALVGFAEAASVSQAYAEADRIPWDPNREFVSQGVANLAAGLTGGFPVGASFSRSAVNRVAGAVTRMSGGVTGLTVLLFLPFAYLLEPLPKAVLGAIVVGAVLGLLKPGPLIELARLSPLQGITGLVTFVLTLLSAPNIEWGVVGGILVALVVHLYREQRVEVDVVADAGGSTVVRPCGVLWFGSAPLARERLVAELTALPDDAVVRLDLDQVGRVDLSAALVLRELLHGARRRGQTIALGHVPPHATRVIQQVMPEELPEGTRDDQRAGAPGP